MRHARVALPAVSGALLLAVSAHDAHAASGNGVRAWPRRWHYLERLTVSRVGGQRQLPGSDSALRPGRQLPGPARRRRSELLSLSCLGALDHFAGATLGAAETDEPDTQILYGLWGGFAEDLGDAFFDDELDYLNDSTRDHWILSLSIGWRGIGKTQQFYLTPKVWRMRGWDFFT